MSSLISTASIIAIIVVAIVLALGLWNMLKGDNPNLSQRLMRWRVGLQALAVLLLMIGLYLSTK